MSLQSRRTFIRAAAGLAAAGPSAMVYGCGDVSSKLAGPEWHGLKSLAVPPPEPPYPYYIYPEDLASFDVQDVAPAINEALASAATSGLWVLLGRDYSEYAFRTPIYVGGYEEYVTLIGTSGSWRIRLRNVSSASNRDRLIMLRRGILHGLHICSNGANPAGTPGVDAGADAPDGSGDQWTVSGCEIEGFNGIGLNFGNFTSYCDVQDNYIHHNSYNAGIQVGMDCLHNNIKGNRVEFNGYNGIDCNGSYNTIAHNSCQYNGTTSATTPDKNGILVGGLVFPDGTRTNSIDNVIEHNYCKQNGRCGIFVGGGHMARTIIRHNEAHEHQGNSGIMVEALDAVATNTDLTITDNIGAFNEHHAIRENGVGTVTYNQFVRNVGYKVASNPYACFSISVPVDSSNTCTVV